MESEPLSESLAEPPAAATPAKRQETWGETLRFFLYLFLGALVLRSFIIAPFSIPSGSMLPNLMIGDYLFVTKWPYGYSRYSIPFGLASFDGRIFARTPDRGDIVVFRHPAEPDKDLVKRVIGLPGDTVEVRRGIVILNGTPIPRARIADFNMTISPNSPCRSVARDGARRIDNPDGTSVCAYPRFRETLPGGRSYEVLDQTQTSPGDNVAPIVVPEGHLLVMGDNRDDSLDGRFDPADGGVGLLPIDNVLGEAAIAFWSTDGSAEWVKPWTWFTAARWNRLARTY